jgi:hypothetical protein
MTAEEKSKLLEENSLLKKLIKLDPVRYDHLKARVNEIFALSKQDIIIKNSTYGLGTSNQTEEEDPL